MKEMLGFIYDIPKKPELFTNKKITEFIESKGFQNIQIQMIKDKKVDEDGYAN